MLPQITILVIACIGGYLQGVTGFFLWGISGLVGVILLGLLLNFLDGGLIPRKQKKVIYEEILLSNYGVLKNAFPGAEEHEAKEKLFTLIDAIAKRALAINPSWNINNALTSEVFLEAAAQIEKEQTSESRKKIVRLICESMCFGLLEDAASSPDHLALLALAAERGDAGAQFNLGLMYDLGSGVPRDRAEAAKWYHLAADQGNADAQRNLGLMYANGHGVPQDYSEAVKWFRRAADQRNADAQFNLGRMYDLGQGVPQDYADALKWYRLAADQGNADAQFNLGRMYDLGSGVPRDRAEAAKWYHLAADQGNADAQFNLGRMYDLGRGVPQNDAEAIKWYRLAAEQGYARAQHELAFMYKLGKGTYARDSRKV